MGEITEEERDFFDQQISSADTVVVSYDWGMVQRHAGIDEWGLPIYEDSEAFPEYFDNLAEQAGELVSDLWPSVQYRIETDGQPSNIDQSEVLIHLETDEARIDYGDNLSARWSMVVDDRPIVYFGSARLGGLGSRMSESAWEAMYTRASNGLDDSITELNGQ